MDSGQKYIRTYLDDSVGDSLFTPHYINEVIPQSNEFKQYSCKELSAWIEGIGRKPLAKVFDESKKLNEDQTEEDLIKPILRMLDNKIKTKEGG